MKNLVSIAPATLDDIPAIARIHVETWRTAYSEIMSKDYLESLTYEQRENQWKSAIDRMQKNWHLNVAKNSKSEIVGFSCGGKCRDKDQKVEGEVYAIYLANNHQKLGIGKELFLASLEQLVRDGYQSALVWVLEQNPTLNFYKYLSGAPRGEKWEEIGGRNLKEIAVVWDDLREFFAARKMRHPCIKHYTDIQHPDTAAYPNSSEILSQGAAFGRYFGFSRIGIHHELLMPGRRTSWPHAESSEDEFVYVVSGHPDVWIDGEIYRLNPGDGVGFRSGTGIAHTFINNTREDVQLVAVGDKTRPENKIYYPKNPSRDDELGERNWTDHPKRILGAHDGRPGKTN